MYFTDRGHRGAREAPRATRRSPWPGWPTGCRSSSTPSRSSRSPSSGWPPGWPASTTPTTSDRPAPGPAHRRGRTERLRRTYEWPATVPAVEQLLREGSGPARGVTLLVGENGSGKSTIVEAVAMAFGLSPEGGSTRRGTSRPHATESALHELDPARARRRRAARGGSSCARRPCTASTPTWRPPQAGVLASRASTR